MEGLRLFFLKEHLSHAHWQRLAESFILLSANSEQLAASSYTVLRLALKTSNAFF